MLANGIKLQVSDTLGGSGTYTDLTGLKEVPDLGVEPEKVENTTLADKVKQYELGIGDTGELEYKFKFENKTDSSYRKLRGYADAKKVVSFKQIYPDTTEVTFDAQVSVIIGGGGVNGVIDFTAKLGLQSDLTFKDPVTI